MKFTGKNLNEVFRLPIVESICKNAEGQPVLHLTGRHLKYDSLGKEVCTEVVFPGETICSNNGAYWIEEGNV